MRDATSSDLDERFWTSELVISERSRHPSQSAFDVALEVIPGEVRSDSQHAALCNSTRTSPVDSMHKTRLGRSNEEIANANTNSFFIGLREYTPGATARPDKLVALPELCQ